MSTNLEKIDTSSGISNSMDGSLIKSCLFKQLFKHTCVQNQNITKLMCMLIFLGRGDCLDKNVRLGL